MSEDTKKHAGGRLSYRLYVLPGGTEYTLADLKRKYEPAEVEAIVKRCQRHSQGHSIKHAVGTFKKVKPIPDRLAHVQDYLKMKKAD